MKQKVKRRKDGRFQGKEEEKVERGSWNILIQNAVGVDPNKLSPSFVVARRNIFLMSPRKTTQDAS